MTKIHISCHLFLLLLSLSLSISLSLSLYTHEAYRPTHDGDATPHAGRHPACRCGRGRRRRGFLSPGPSRDQCLTDSTFLRHCNTRMITSTSFRYRHVASYERRHLRGPVECLRYPIREAYRRGLRGEAMASEGDEARPPLLDCLTGHRQRT
jgi:hypothetical protein